MADLGVGQRALADLGMHADRRHDLTRRAVAALEGVVLEERSLNGMQFITPRKTFDGRNLPTLVHDGESQAGVDADAVDVYGACAALTVIATLLRAGKVVGRRVGHEEPTLRYLTPASGSR